MDQLSGGPSWKNPAYQLFHRGEPKPEFYNTLKTGEEREIEVIRETYERERDQRRITIHKCIGDGYGAFKTLLKDKGVPLSVFFYRGDSGGAGEGSSGFKWLKSRLKNVLEVLVEDGLIVSDGSNAIRRLTRQESFTHAEKHFEYLGYLDDRNHSSLVWQVKRI